MSLVSKWNESHARARNAKDGTQKYKQAIAAIVNGDSDGLKAVIESIADIDHFRTHHINDLLKGALVGGDVELFKPLYRVINNNPNYIFHVNDLYADGGPRFDRQERLLYIAIESKAEKIAIFLADEKNCDIRTSGFQSFSYCDHKTQKMAKGYMPYKTPIELARAYGMKSLVMALAVKEASLKQQEVNALRREVLSWKLKN